MSHSTSQPCFFLQAREALGVPVPKARSPVGSTGRRPGRWRGKPGPRPAPRSPSPSPTPHTCRGTEVSGGRPPHTSPPDSKPLRFPLQCDTFPAAVTPHRRSRWRGGGPRCEPCPADWDGCLSILLTISTCVSLQGKKRKNVPSSETMKRNKEIFDMCVYGFGRNLKRQLPRFPETKQDRKTGRPSDGHLAGSLFTRLRTCVQRRLEIPSRGNEKNRAC